MDDQTLRRQVNSILKEKGFFLVELKVDKQNRIIIHIDKPEGIRIEDCVKVSRELEGRFDQDTEDFALEVSSPGLDSPFRVMEQYHKNTGRKIEVRKLDGHIIRGTLVEVQDDGILVQPEIKGKKEKEAQGISMQFREIQSTRVLLSI